MTAVRRTWRWWTIDAAGLACCLALTGAGYGIAVVPVLRSGERVAHVRSEVEAVERRAEALEQMTRKLDQSLSRIRSRLDDSTLELEPAERVNRRVDELTRLAGESGLTIDEVLPGAPEAGSLYRTVRIRISGTGSYPQCADFLHRLRTRLRDTTVRSLRLVADAEDGSGSTFVFELVWYAAPADRDG